MGNDDKNELNASNNHGTEEETKVEIKKVDLEEECKAEKAE